MAYTDDEKTYNKIKKNTKAYDEMIEKENKRLKRK